MLFALDWMKATWDRIISWILDMTRGLSIASAASALTGRWTVLVCCLLAGLALCIYGFRCHKPVFGAVCAALLAVLGWHIGSGVNAEYISVPALYAVLFAVTGFFAFYILWFLAVFSGGWFFFIAVLAPFAAPLHGSQLWVAALLAAVYSAFYMRYKLAMSAVTGALVLGLAAYALSPGLGAAVFCAAAAGGICLQLMLRKKYYEKRALTSRKQIEKYPYGPGQAYGWPEPGKTDKS